jgi:hypothetical protein
MFGAELKANCAICWYYYTDILRGTVKNLKVFLLEYHTMSTGEGPQRFGT